MNDDLLLGLMVLMTSSFNLITYKAYALKRGLQMGTLFINEKATLWGLVGLGISLLFVLKSGDWFVGIVLGLLAALVACPISLVMLRVYSQIASLIGLGVGVLLCLAS